MIVETDHPSEGVSARKVGVSKGHGYSLSVRMSGIIAREAERGAAVTAFTLSWEEFRRLQREAREMRTISLPVCRESIRQAIFEGVPVYRDDMEHWQ